MNQILNRNRRFSPFRFRTFCKKFKKEHHIKEIEINKQFIEDFKKWQGIILVLQQMDNYLILYDEKANVVLTTRADQRIRIIRTLHKFSKEILQLSQEPTQDRIFEFETFEQYQNFFTIFRAKLQNQKRNEKR